MHSRAIRALAAADPRLKAAIRLIGPCTLAPDPRPPYQALLRAIGHQQLHGNAARAILARFQALYGLDPQPGRWPTPAELLATPEAKLRSVGLSRAKVRAFRAVAARTADGTVPSLKAIARLSDAAIIERLIAVDGVGRWTAEMLLIFALGRPDVLPVGDFGIREGFRLLYGKRRQPTPASLARFGARWAPYRTVAAWYLWRYVEHARSAKTAPARPGTRKRRRP